MIPASKCAKIRQAKNEADQEADRWLRAVLGVVTHRQIGLDPATQLRLELVLRWAIGRITAR